MKSKEEKDLETLVKKDEPKKEVKAESKESKKESKEPERSSHDQDWKKIGTMFRSLAKNLSEEKSDEDAPIVPKKQPTLEQDLASQPQQQTNPNLPPQEEKGIYSSRQSEERGPYSLQEPERNIYLPDTAQQTRAEETTFDRLQKDIRLASNIVSERFSEEERARQEGVYDSLRRSSGKDSTQKYKRVERF